MDSPMAHVLQPHGCGAWSGPPRRGGSMSIWTGPRTGRPAAWLPAVLSKRRHCPAYPAYKTAAACDDTVVSVHPATGNRCTVHPFLTSLSESRWSLSRSMCLYCLRTPTFGNPYGGPPARYQRSGKKITVSSEDANVKCLAQIFCAWERVGKVARACCP